MEHFTYRDATPLKSRCLSAVGRGGWWFSCLAQKFPGSISTTAVGNNSGLSKPSLWSIRGISPALRIPVQTRSLFIAGLVASVQAHGSLSAPHASLRFPQAFLSFIPRNMPSPSQLNFIIKHSISKHISLSLSLSLSLSFLLSPSKFRVLCCKLTSNWCFNPSFCLSEWQRKRCQLKSNFPAVVVKRWVNERQKKK